MTDLRWYGELKSEILRYCCFAKPYKVSYCALFMPKKDLIKAKAETAVVKGTVTQNQKEAISNLVGILGSNEQDVVGKILTLWLYNEGFLGGNNKKDGGQK